MTLAPSPRPTQPLFDRIARLGAAVALAAFAGATVRAVMRAVLLIAAWFLAAVAFGLVIVFEHVIPFTVSRSDPDAFLVDDHVHRGLSAARISRCMSFVDPALP